MRGEGDGLQAFGRRCSCNGVGGGGGGGRGAAEAVGGRLRALRVAPDNTRHCRGVDSENTAQIRFKRVAMREAWPRVIGVRVSTTFLIFQSQAPPGITYRRKYVNRKITKNKSFLEPFLMCYTQRSHPFPLPLSNNP
jgi:hypothetical protein